MQHKCRQENPQRLHHFKIELKIVLCCFALVEDLVKIKLKKTYIARYSQSQYSHAELKRGKEIVADLDFKFSQFRTKFSKSLKFGILKKNWSTLVEMWAKRWELSDAYKGELEESIFMKENEVRCF